MIAKSLREIQQKGEKSVGTEPIVLTNRKGPVGILIPVTEETFPFIQREVRKLTALESLRKTWESARVMKLDRMPESEIQDEVKALRKRRRHAK